MSHPSPPVDAYSASSADLSAVGAGAGEGTGLGRLVGSCWLVVFVVVGWLDDDDDGGRSWKAVRDRSRRRGALPKGGTAGAGSAADVWLTTSSAAKMKRVATASMLSTFQSINFTNDLFRVDK